MVKKGLEMMGSNVKKIRTQENVCFPMVVKLDIEEHPKVWILFPCKSDILVCCRLYYLR